MSNHRRAAVVLAAIAAAVACGRTPLDLEETHLVSAGSLPPGGPDAGPAPDASSPAACVPLDTDTPAPLPGCAFDTASHDDRPVLAGVIGDTLVFVDQSGKPRAGFVFDQTKTFTDDYIVQSTSAARGRYVAAAVQIVDKHPGADPHATAVEVVLLRGNEVVFHETQKAETGAYEGPFTITGNEHGVFAFGFQLGSRARLAVIAQGTVVARTEGMTVLTDPDDRGRVAGYAIDTDAGSSPVTWFDPCTGARAPSHYSAQPLQGQLTPLQASLVYADLTRPALVVESADGPSRVELSGMVPPGSIDLFDVEPGGFALVSTSATLGFVAVDTHSGNVADRTLVFPPGFGFFSAEVQRFDPPNVSSGGQLRIGKNGALVMAMRSPSQGFVASSPDGAHWTMLGIAYNDATWLNVYTRGDVAAGLAVGTPKGNWQPPPAGPILSGQTAQSIELDGTSDVLLDPGTPGDQGPMTYDLSEDGRCVSSWDDTSVRAVDTATGLVTLIDIAAVVPKDRFSLFSRMTWVPGTNEVLVRY